MGDTSDLWLAIAYVCNAIGVWEDTSDAWSVIAQVWIAIGV